MKFRQRTRFVEAMQLTTDNHDEMITWVERLAQQAGYSAPNAASKNGYLIIVRGYPDDDDVAEPGQYVVQGAPGYFYPVSEQAFVATYEPAEEGS